MDVLTGDCSPCDPPLNSSNHRGRIVASSYHRECLQAARLVRNIKALLFRRI